MRASAVPQSSTGIEVRFLTGFALWLVAFGVADILAGARLDPLTTLAARGIAAVIAWTGVPAVHEGSLVLFGGARMDVVVECLGLRPIALLCAFVLAFPARPARKARGVLVGAAILLAANALRLLASAGILLLAPALFAWVHDVVWQLGFAGLAAWLAWRWAEDVRRA